MYIFLPVVLYILLYVALSHYILFCICFAFHLHIAFYIVPIVQWEVPPKLRRLRCRLLAALSSFSFICILSTFVSVQILHPLLSQHLSNIVSIFLPPLLKYLLWTSQAQLLIPDFSSHPVDIPAKAQICIFHKCAQVIQMCLMCIVQFFQQIKSPSLLHTVTAHS